MSLERLVVILSVSLTLSCGDDSSGDDGGDPTGEDPTTDTPTSTDGGTAEDDATSDTGPTSDDADSTGTDTGPGQTVPEFGETFTVIGTAADGLDAPRDLEFAPDAENQLWTFNTLIHGTVIFFDPGAPEQSSEVRVDAYGEHFMAFVSSGAFGDNGNFATCQESRNEWNVGPQDPDNFMGPSLWPADLAVYAVVGQEFPPGAQEGSHLDMLHQSPWCMGIAHESANAYWVFDGWNDNIVRYDFVMDHGAGGGDHSDGIIRRYMDATVTRVMNVPSHMEYDHATGMLYVADSGANRIMRLDTNTGMNTGDLPGNWDGADEYSGWEGADYQVVVDGLDVPSGLALHDDRLFITEQGSNEIIAFDLDGNELGRLATPATFISGITVGPNGQLWYVDPAANEVVRVDP